MKTTLDLPADLLAEACAALGVDSASEAVELALLELVKRNRAVELKSLLGRISFEFDPADLRRRERAAATELGAGIGRSSPPGTHRHRRPKA